MLRSSLPVILAYGFLSLPLQAQVIDIPSEIVEGARVPLRVTGLVPSSTMELSLRRITKDGTTSESRARYQVSSDGSVDPASSSATGDYVGVDAAGPFWSMRPATPANENHGTLTVIATTGGRQVAKCTVPLLPWAQDIIMKEVDAFPGARLYRRQGKQRLPIIIVLGGSEGGSSGARGIAPRLAELGYAALSLPYYNPSWTGEKLPNLPQAFVDIPVDRLEQVKRWIDRQEGLNRHRVGIYGVSKGGEFAMLAGARFSWLRAVVGIVPSDVVWEGWGTSDGEGKRSSFAMRGKPLPFVPYRGMREAISALERGEQRTLVEPHLEGRRAEPERAAAGRIPVEQFRGAMLVAGGDLDATWPSGEMVRAIAERRAAAQLQTVALSFARAGHGLAGTGWSPMNFPRAKDTVVANAQAQRLIWTATQSFLADHLADEPRR